MSFLSLSEDTVDVTVRDGSDKGTFTLKKALSVTDVEYAFMQVLDATKDFPRRDDVTAPTEAQPLNLDMVLGLPVGQVAVLEKAVVEWDLTYPKGHPDSPGPIPLTVENIRLLTLPVVQQLVTKVRDLNHVRSATEEKNLGSNSSHTSTARTTSPTN